MSRNASYGRSRGPAVFPEGDFFVVDVFKKSLPTPMRAMLSDDPRDILRFAVNAYREGRVALAILVDIRGGAARALGSQVVVAADGRFSGYVSGGCVEAAVAAEALLAMETRSDRMVSFGDGSPFLDIVLPCGGGITVAIHVLRSVDIIEYVLQSLAQRKSAGLKYEPERQALTSIEPPERAGVKDGNVYLVYRPVTRVIASGQKSETQSVQKIAVASGYEVLLCEQNEHTAELGQHIDAYTAFILLHHDLDQETKVLDIALRSSAFYIGALGSFNTHRRRIERLSEFGYTACEIDRINAPIGIFGPARDSATLGLSVLPDVAKKRSQRYP